ncbi:Transcriptional activator chrR [Candidatus Phaeomarinobacter ectocarpi]|uniref:Transcriptional activator chrR n=2 Tax=Candidatus Phaeomarinibacter ectocarpi TaxID=1458461 RepID=X5MPB7_9HYPH|nr:Transcriptional activator chrR [Candidatus Phaeomarinobacter ectocarpi]
MQHMPHTPRSAPSVDWLISQYALGQLPRAAALLAETYLEMNPQQRHTADRIEQVGGWSLERAEPVSMRAQSADALLAQLEEGDTLTATAPIVSPRPTPSPLPASLTHAVGQPLSDIAWKWRGIGAYEYRLKEFEDEGIVARLLRIEPGKAVPQHTHEGMEATLVVQGAYSDDAGRFGPGDLELADDAVDHKPIAERGETCICFAVTEAPMKLTGRIGRIFQSLL